MTRTIYFALFVVPLVGWLSIPVAGTQQDDRSATGIQLKSLLEARRDTLEEILDVMEKKYEDGSLGFAAVADARDAFLLAELELAESEQQRIEICRKRIVNLHALEKSAALRFDSGAAQIEEKLLATAQRLQVEIDCARRSTRSK